MKGEHEHILTSTSMSTSTIMEIRSTAMPISTSMLMIMTTCIRTLTATAQIRTPTITTIPAIMDSMIMTIWDMLTNRMIMITRNSFKSPYRKDAFGTDCMLLSLFPN